MKNKSFFYPSHPVPQFPSPEPPLSSFLCILNVVFYTWASLCNTYISFKNTLVAYVVFYSVSWDSAPPLS